MRKFTPSEPLADNFVRETDWQKDDNIVTHDDLYAHTWDTNFGTDPFDTELPDNEQDDIQENVPINRPPSLEISKNSGEAPVEQSTVPNVETPTEKAENEIDAIDNQQDLLPDPTTDAEKTPGKTAENQENEEVQKEKPLPIHVVKNIIYDPTQILTSQTHTDTENKSTTKTQLSASYCAPLIQKNTTKSLRQKLKLPEENIQISSIVQ